MSQTPKLLVIFCLIFLGISTAFLVVPKTASADACLPNISKQCISNIVYWYNSCGVLQTVYQNCNLTNQLCQNSQCVNNPSEPVPYPTPATTTQNQTTNNQTTNNQTQANVQNQQGQIMVTSLFAKKEKESGQWEKLINAVGNDNIHFLLVIKNTSDSQVDNVTIKTDLTGNLAYTGNLKINDFASAGSIVDGIDIGSLGPKASVAASFSASVPPQAAIDNVKINATANGKNTANDSDYILLNIAGQNTTALASQPGNSFASNISKNWYLLGIIAIVLIIVFVIIYRKLSSNV